MKTAKIIFACLTLLMGGIFFAAIMQMSLPGADKFQVGIYAGAINFFASIVGMLVAIQMKRTTLAGFTFSKMASIAVLVIYNPVFYCIIAVAIEIAIFIAFITPIQEMEGAK